jgi:hypothetical protein
MDRGGSFGGVGGESVVTMFWPHRACGFARSFIAFDQEMNCNDAD